MILGPALPEEREEIVARRLHSVCLQLRGSACLSEAAKETSARVTFKIDTGMGRMGFAESDAIGDAQSRIALPGVAIHSVSTHLPAADEDPDYTQAAAWPFP